MRKAGLSIVAVLLACSPPTDPTPDGEHVDCARGETDVGAEFTCTNNALVTAFRRSDCSTKENGDGTVTVTCDEHTRFTAAPGEAFCTVSRRGQDQVILCADDVAVMVRVVPAASGVTCAQQQNADDTSTFSCTDGVAVTFDPGPVGTGPDGGILDAGDVDAGDVDAGDVDAGDVDAGDVDAGDVDAGDVDAGDVDAGDGGSPDAGTPTVACGADERAVRACTRTNYTSMGFDVCERLEPAAPHLAVGGASVLDDAPPPDSMLIGRSGWEGTVFVVDGPSRVTLTSERLANQFTNTCLSASCGGGCLASTSPMGLGESQTDSVVVPAGVYFVHARYLDSKMYSWSVVPASASELPDAGHPSDPADAGEPSDAGSAPDAGSGCMSTLECPSLGQSTSCVAGHCVGIVTDAPYVTEIGLHEDRLYWSAYRGVSTDHGTLQRIGTRGGLMETLASSRPDPQPISLTGTHLYWSELRNSALTNQIGGVFRIPLGGGAVETVVAPVTYPHQMAASGDAVLYSRVTTTGGREIMAYRNGGSSLVQPTSPSFLTAIDGTFYWCADQALYSQPAEGGPVTTIASGLPGLRGLAIRDGHAYAVSHMGMTQSSVGVGKVLRIALADGAVTTLAEAPMQPVAMVADGHHIYWTSFRDGDLNGAFVGSGSVRRVPLEGGSVEILISGEPGPRGMLQDEATIYWSTAGGYAGVSSTGRLRALLK